MLKTLIPQTKMIKTRFYEQSLQNSNKRSIKTLILMCQNSSQNLHMGIDVKEFAVYNIRLQSKSNYSELDWL